MRGDSKPGCGALKMLELSRLTPGGGGEGRSGQVDSWSRIYGLRVGDNGERPPLSGAGCVNLASLSVEITTWEGQTSTIHGLVAIDAVLPVAIDAALPASSPTFLSPLSFLPIPSAHLHPPQSSPFPKSGTSHTCVCPPGAAHYGWGAQPAPAEIFASRMTARGTPRGYTRPAA